MPQPAEMDPPSGVLVCPPDFFDVVDVKNPFMDPAARVDRDRARAQWDGLVAAFAFVGLAVDRVPPTPGCEDMVFCANQCFAGPGAVVLGRMRHESRQREVPAFRDWFAARGDAVHESPVPFEGGGDAIWHPGRRLVWGGVGPRTSAEAYALVESVFGTPVERLRLATDRFYHLDTCFLPLDETTVLVYPPALDGAGLGRIGESFERIIEVSDADASRFACNAVAWRGRVIIEEGCEVSALLRDLGYEVVEVATGEFRKSGGSVFCLKQWVY